MLPFSTLPILENGNEFSTPKNATTLVPVLSYTDNPLAPNKA